MNKEWTQGVVLCDEKPLDDEEFIHCHIYCFINTAETSFGIKLYGDKKISWSESLFIHPAVSDGPFL